MKKHCFVPFCKSTELSTPNKIFVCVPEKDDLRKIWCETVGRSLHTTPKISYCCEDHFIVSKHINDKNVNCNEIF